MLWLGVLASTAASAHAQGTISLVPESVRAAYLAGTRSPTGAPGEQYWQVRPHYALDVRLAPDSGYVAGEGTITVSNPSPHAWDSVVLRLDLNRFQSDSLHHGGMVLRSFTVNGWEVSRSIFDRHRGTVLTIVPPAAIMPGDTARIQMSWIAHIPESRTGDALRQGRWGTELFQVAQWYPRLAMFDDLAGWDTEEHNGQREFYNPFGHYQVRIAVPAGWPVGATGRLTNAQEVLSEEGLEHLQIAQTQDTTVVIVPRSTESVGSSHDMAIWSFQADSVSDFAWGTSRLYEWRTTSRTIGTARVLVHVLTARHVAEMADAGQRVADLLEGYSSVLSPYAWENHTLLDGPEAAMEYPGLTMSNGGILHHEIAHQWFPMMVGTDETRFDFLDEGTATYLAGVISGTSRTRTTERAGHEPLVRDVRTPAGLALGYGRGSRMLDALAERFGAAKVNGALKSYASEWRFRHPSPWDFMSLLERSLGQSLETFWRAWLFEAEAIPG